MAISINIIGRIIYMKNFKKKEQKFLNFSYDLFFLALGAEKVVCNYFNELFYFWPKEESQ
jgi:hypothetical protein